MEQNKCWQLINIEFVCCFPPNINYFKYILSLSLSIYLILKLLAPVNCYTANYQNRQKQLIIFSASSSQRSALSFFITNNSYTCPAALDKLAFQSEDLIIHSRQYHWGIVKKNPFEPVFLFLFFFFLTISSFSLRDDNNFSVIACNLTGIRRISLFDFFSIFRTLSEKKLWTFYF